MALTTFFKDTFTGGSYVGLASHAPDVGFAGVSYTAVSGGYSVNGSGYLTGPDMLQMATYGDKFVDQALVGTVDVSVVFTITDPTSGGGNPGIQLDVYINNTTVSLIFIPTIYSTLGTLAINEAHNGGNVYGTPVEYAGISGLGPHTFTATISPLEATLTVGTTTVTLAQVNTNSTYGFRGIKIFQDPRNVQLISSITITSGADESQIITSNILLPKPQINVVPGSRIALSLPAISLISYSGARSEIAFPKLAVGFTAHDSTGEQAANITLPSLSVAITTGANAKASLPALSVDASGTVTNLANAPITLPLLTVESGVTVASMANADITLPSLSAIAYSGALCSVTIGSLTMQATGTVGSVASAQVTLPLLQATSQATANGYGGAAITLPMLSVSTGAKAALTLPGLKLTAIGTATVTATYEAYAVNLNHQRGVTNQEIPINETTRYTNFPFTHVVRYMNSYYGANSTGLYLLEGTTDAGTAIPFDVKTAMTDFKSPTKKTVESAYFSGRFGPASTITLTAGEDTPKTYSYSTPRDQNAQNHRQTFGKGLKERYYSLELAGTGALELDGIEMNVKNLSRRI